MELKNQPTEFLEWKLRFLYGYWALSGLTKDQENSRDQQIQDITEELTNRKLSNQSPS
jgi:hypothetical protein